MSGRRDDDARRLAVRPVEAQLEEASARSFDGAGGRAGAGLTSPVQLLQRSLGNSRLVQLRQLARHGAGPVVQRSAAEMPDWIRQDLGIDEAMVERGQRLEAELAQAETIAVPEGGERLPEPVQRLGEQHLGVSLDDVKLARNADRECQAIGAQAFAADRDGAGHTIALASDVDLDSPDGQFTLLHEVSHIEQQKAGRTDGLHGIGGDPEQRERLEDEADRRALRMLGELR